MLHDIESNRHGPRGQAMADAVGTCVHCGFCLPACPTYQELENEQDSPRGRILLMKSVLEGELSSQQAAPHIDRCLGCLACVTHCPSGVPYGDLLNSYRSRFRESEPKPTTFRDWLIRNTLPYPRRFRWAMRFGKLGRLFHFLTPPSLKPMLDLVPSDLPSAQILPERTAPIGKRVGRVALLAGCAQQVLAPDINAATVRVLSENGVEVVIPRSQGCCGALDWHTGNSKSAVLFAERLIQSLPNDVDCLITNAAGCGSAIHEYPLLMADHPLRSRAEEFAKRTVDVSVYLDSLRLRPVPPLQKPLKVAYHDACHLAHAQSVRLPPRRLLSSVPGLELLDLMDSDTCCGSAGTYNIEQPQLAQKLGLRKANAVIASHAAVVATGNIGCLVQIQKQLVALRSTVSVLHTMQILDRAYRQVLS